MKNFFITFEGGEGTGKTTQAGLLCARLHQFGCRVLLTREPGGSLKAERFRKILLSGFVREVGDSVAEAFILSAARRDHVQELIQPALARNIGVVCDRFIDSTWAYQQASGVAPDLLKALERLSVGPLRPSLTFVLDVPTRLSLSRINARARLNSQPSRKEGTALERESGASPPQLDRFEREELYFHQQVRDHFQALCREEPERCHFVDAQRSEMIISEEIWKCVSKRFSL